MRLLIGTGNKGKLLEISEGLAGLQLELKGLGDFPFISQPEETGETFVDNAILKAKSYSAQTGLWTLADDSGLEVEVLKGLPGVISSRYAGSGASDTDNIRKLLNELGNEENRKARFVCVMVVADEKGEIRFVGEGVCSGIIAYEPRGINGFGYDPIFIPDGFEETFGELPSSVKQKISHRAEALRKVNTFFRDFIGNIT